MVGGVPTLRSGWWGGTYLPRSGVGGVPTLRSGWEGTYLPRSGVGGYLLSGLDGGVPTFEGPGGGVPTQGWMGGTYLGRYPPPRVGTPPPE